MHNSLKRKKDENSFLRSSEIYYFCRKYDNCFCFYILQMTWFLFDSEKWHYQEYFVRQFSSDCRYQKYSFKRRCRVIVKVPSFSPSDCVENFDRSSHRRRWRRRRDFLIRVIHGVCCLKVLRFISTKPKVAREEKVIK